MHCAALGQPYSVLEVMPLLPMHAAACPQVFGLRVHHDGCKDGDKCEKDCKDNKCDKCEKCGKDEKDCKDGCKMAAKVRPSRHGCQVSMSDQSSRLLCDLCNQQGRLISNLTVYISRCWIHCRSLQCALLKAYSKSSIHLTSSSAAPHSTTHGEASLGCSVVNSACSKGAVSPVHNLPRLQQQGPPADQSDQSGLC
jgi:hypothetical protein